MIFFDLVIFNGYIVSGSDILPPTTYIGIKDHVISLISAEPLAGKKIIDARGAFITPGGIDAHVHLEEPGSIYCDTFRNCTKAALAGGTTSVISFAVQSPNDTDQKSDILDVIANYKKAASGNCFCDYGFHLIVRNPVQSLLDSLPMVKEEGITSIKVFTTYDMFKLNDSQLLTMLLENRKLGITQMIHAENYDIIRYLNEKLEEKNLLRPYYHAVSRPVEAEDEASYRVIQLSKIIDIPILIVHMSIKEALDHVRRAQNNLLPIMAETCPQYLFLTNDYLKENCIHHHDQNDEFEGAKYVCSPPLRDTENDLKGVWQSIQNGTVTIFSSDHAPSNYDDIKGKKLGLINGLPDYKEIPNGMPGVETRVPLLFCQGVEKGKISPQRFVELTSTNPAKIYGLGTRKGSIQVGYDADIVIWHPKGEIDFVLENEMLVHEFDYTPFENLRFSNWPKYTILRGKLVYEKELGVIANADFGKFMKRSENTLTKSVSVQLNPILE